MSLRSSIYELRKVQNRSSENHIKNTLYLNPKHPCDIPCDRSVSWNNPSDGQAFAPASAAELFKDLALGLQASWIPLMLCLEGFMKGIGKGRVMSQDFIFYFIHFSLPFSCPPEIFHKSKIQTQPKRHTYYKKLDRGALLASLWRPIRPLMQELDNSPWWGLKQTMSAISHSSLLD